MRDSWGKEGSTVLRDTQEPCTCFLVFKKYKL